MKVCLISIGEHVSNTISMDCDIIQCLTNTNHMDKTQNWYTLKHTPKRSLGN